MKVGSCKVYWNSKNLCLYIILRDITLRMMQVRIDLLGLLIISFIGIREMLIKITVTPSILMALRSLLLTRRWETVRVV